MTDHPKRTTSSFKDLQLKAGQSGGNALGRLRMLFSSLHTFIPLLSGILLILTGLALISITILSFIKSIWISAVLTLLGSVSSMMGVFLIYQTVSTQGAFDSLINKAIRRVIDHQN